MLMIGKLKLFGYMSSNVFEKIVTIVAKVVQILEFAVETFFGSQSDSSAKVD